MKQENRYMKGLFSPTDYRYGVDALKPYLTDRAYIEYKLKVEIALIKVLSKKGFCSKAIADEIIKACNTVDIREVDREEEKVKHDIRALVNVIRKKICNKAKPYVHLTATSYDIVDTANAMRLRDAALGVILPDMMELEKLWIKLAVKYRDTIQIGRTHGQHANPITFGFALAGYVNRWGDRILNLKAAAEKLTGKFSGAVGSYNASSLFFSDPEKFEKDVLAELGLAPALVSTQIVPQEPVTDLVNAVVSAFGVLANFSDDMRNLQRTEISEVSEAFGEKQVGSSTMPQKRNPINFENVKSMWKEFMPRMVTVYMDQISEHQRDLTNSCSQRYLPELLVAFDSSVRRMVKVAGRLRVDEDSLKTNFDRNKDKAIAEPLYIILAYLGHPDAHEYVRKLAQKSTDERKPLSEILSEDKTIKSYMRILNAKQKDIIKNPEKYTGIASKKVDRAVSYWKKKLKIR